MFLLEVRTLGGLSAHNSAVHWLVVDFEVWQVGLRMNSLTVVCQPLVNEAPDEVRLYEISLHLPLTHLSTFLSTYDSMKSGWSSRKASTWAFARGPCIFRSKSCPLV